MSPRSFIIAGLRHRWKAHLAVALAVAVATAILTGALVIGDSVRGSLRNLALDRLGYIDRLLVTPQPFRPELANELAAKSNFKQHFTRAVPLLVLTGSIEYRDGGNTRRASDVEIVGYSDEFWKLARDERKEQAAGVLVTQAVADELHLSKSATSIVLRLPTASALPADSALGNKLDTTLAEPLKIDGVIAGEGLARFDLFASQRPPRTIFVPLQTLQRIAERKDEANVLALASSNSEVPTGDDATAWLAKNVRPQLADYGLTLAEHRAGEANYWQLTSRGLVLRDIEQTAIHAATPDTAWQPASTYLANRIKLGDRGLSYSLVSGIDSVAAIGPVLGEQAAPIKLADNQIALNRWAADQLGAKVGDKLSFTYYDPESTHGELHQQTSPELAVTQIVELATADGKPTPAADPNLTPELEGVTDEASIADWDLPFELTEPITDADEVYWDEYSTTPKAFISYKLAQKLFTSRWGSTSLLRTPVGAGPVADFGSQLASRLTPDELGLKFLPAKRTALAAATGTTPFDGLFFGFSMFLIASAVALLVIIFRLVLDARVREVGTLLAMGYRRATVQRLVGAEQLVVAGVGALAGVAAGIGYAWLMVWGLTTVWVAAIASPFLTLQIAPRSLMIGGVTGLVIAAAVTWFALRKLVRQPAIGLIVGRCDETPSQQTSARRRRNWLLPCFVLVAVLSGAAGLWLRGEAQAGAFFACGAATLAALLLTVFNWLRSRSVRRDAGKLGSLGSLATANLFRQPLASTLLIGLVAAATFLLVAISAFRLAPSEEGTGGFTWFATSDQPLLYDLATPDGRLKLGFNQAEDKRLAICRVASFRTSDGEAASCLHLFKPEQPRVLGVDPNALDGADFAWAAQAKIPERAKPWSVLDSRVAAEHIPCVLDANTAMYSLQLYGGVGSTFSIRDGDNNPVTLEVVGLLKNSVLQGDVMVSDDNFRRLFPDVAGHRIFLIADEDQTGQQLDTLLEDKLSDVGFDVSSARDRLAAFLAVQNTYLSTFQTLGGLGLLLGTVGLAAVTLRSVIERRGELALMRATGFRRGRLEILVLLENILLVVVGLLLGIAAAALALVPPALVQDTVPPFRTTLMLLVAVTAMGAFTAWIATRRALDAPLVAALRGD